MNDFDSLTEGLVISTNTIPEKPKEVEIENPFINAPTPVIVKPQPAPVINNSPSPMTLFETRAFQKDLRSKSIEKNKSYQLYSENITAYDIANGCSRSVFYRINNVPTNNYANKWLPVN